MKTKNMFIFLEGIWLGEGNISLTATDDKVKFYTQWIVSEQAGSVIRCMQKVEMEGVPEGVQNEFLFSNFVDGTFEVVLTNEMLGKVMGKGVIDDKLIAWEFRDQPGIEGYETYKLQENGEFSFHAEYASPEQMRTVIDGRIWKKVGE